MGEAGAKRERERPSGLVPSSLTTPTAPSPRGPGRGPPPSLKPASHRLPRQSADFSCRCTMQPVRRPGWSHHIGLHMDGARRRREGRRGQVSSTTPLCVLGALRSRKGSPGCHSLFLSLILPTQVPNMRQAGWVLCTDSQVMVMITGCDIIKGGCRGVAQKVQDRGLAVVEWLRA